MNKLLASRQPSYYHRRPRRSRGQSLTEFAISASILILVFSGAIDLGRAVFTRIIMLSAISEGAHWMAAYPGCVVYGGAFGELNNVVNAPASCKGTNSIFQRIRNESSLLLPANVQSVSLTHTDGSAVSEVKAGQTVVIGLRYRITLITPVMRALFGNTMSLDVNVKEVVRGTTLPSTTGLGSTYTPISSVPIVPMADVSQSDNTSPTPLSSCTDGHPPIRFKEATTPYEPSGYRVYKADSGTGAVLSGWIYDQPDTTPGVASFHYIHPNSASGTTRIAPEFGGHTLYAIQSYKDDPPGGVPEYFSDYIYILATCTEAQPELVSFTCTTPVAPATTSPSVKFTWKMPKNYAWSANQPIDEAITGFKLLKFNGTSYVDVTTFTSWTTGPDQWTFTNNTPLTFVDTPVTDPNRTATYAIRAMKGTDPFGDQSLAEFNLSIACP